MQHLRVRFGRSNQASQDSIRLAMPGDVPENARKFKQLLRESVRTGNLATEGTEATEEKPMRIATDGIRMDTDTKQFFFLVCPICVHLIFYLWQLLFPHLLRVALWLVPDFSPS
jgi:hypothetical protein